MSKRLWLLGVLGLVSIGLLMACGSKYNSSSNGLLLVGSQGSSVIQTFSFGLNNGHVSSIANSVNDTGNQTCILNGFAGFDGYRPGRRLRVCQSSTASTLCPGMRRTLASRHFSRSIPTDNISAGRRRLLSDPNPVALSMDFGREVSICSGGNILPCECPERAALPEQ